MPFNTGLGLFRQNDFFGSGAGAGLAPVVSIPSQTIDFSSTGIVTITHGGLGFTPVAMVISSTFAPTVDTAYTNDAHFSIGSTDGTTQLASCFKCTTGGSTAKSAQVNDAIVIGRNSVDTLFLKMAFDSFIPNGVKLNILQTVAASYIVDVLFIGGPNVQASLDEVTLQTSPGKTVTTGFESNFMFAFGGLLGTDFGSAGTPKYANNAQLSMGFATWDGTTLNQCSHGFFSLTGVTTTQVAGYTDSGKLASIRTTVSASSIQAVSSIGSTSYTLGGESASFSGDHLAILSVHLPKKKVWCGIGTTPTSAGDMVISGTGSKSSTGLAITTKMTATDTLSTTSTAESFGLGYFDKSNGISSSVFDEDNINPKTVERRANSEPFDLYDPSGQAFGGTLKSFNADGATFDLTTVNGSACKWPVALVG